MAAWPMPGHAEHVSFQGPSLESAGLNAFFGRQPRFDVSVLSFSYIASLLPSLPPSLQKLLTRGRESLQSCEVKAA